MPFTRSVMGCSTNATIARAIRSRRLFILQLASTRELQPWVIRRGADEPEGEVVGVLPGYLADQGAVLASLVGEGQGAIGEGRLARDVHRWLPGAVGGPGEGTIVPDRQGDLDGRGGLGRPAPCQLP